MTYTCRTCVCSVVMIAQQHDVVKYGCRTRDCPTSDSCTAAGHTYYCCPAGLSSCAVSLLSAWSAVALPYVLLSDVRQSDINIVTQGYTPTPSQQLHNPRRRPTGQTPAPRPDPAPGRKPPDACVALWPRCFPSARSVHPSPVI